MSSAESRVVSSDQEMLILVDKSDVECGYLSKGACHDGNGVLHRAFSVFLFNDAGELLLQQRSTHKRLWPMYWSNSCCSHPRRGESMDIATERRLNDELNVRADLQFAYRFVYRAQFGDLGTEYENCRVYLGRLNEAARPNDHEIEALRYVSAEALSKELATTPDAFTPWLKLEWGELTRNYSDLLNQYAAPNGVS